jgi:hypothetical protein
MRRPMAMVTRWALGKEIDECGLVLAGIRVSFAELQLAENRDEAIDMGVTSELCDLYESQGGDYKAGTIRDWLETQADEAEALRAEIDAIDAPDMRP